MPAAVAVAGVYAAMHPHTVPPPPLTHSERTLLDQCKRAAMSAQGAPIITYADKAAFEARMARDCDGVTPELLARAERDRQALQDALKAR